MTSDLSLEDLIEKYYSGEMSSEEQRMFEERLDTDEELRHKAEAHRLLAETLKEIEYREAFRTFKTLAESLDRKKQKGASALRRMRTVWYAAAAVFVLAVGAYAYLQFTAEERLFSRYFTVYENVGQFRDEQKPVPENYRKGMEYYDGGDYKQAFVWLQKADRESTDLLEIPFYAGMAALASGRAEEASAYFQKAATEGRFAEPAEWYLALSYVKQGKTEAAKKTLQNIERSSSSYREKAKMLREELEK